MDDLPSSVRMIADVIGLEATFTLIRKLPRTRRRKGQAYCYVPETLTPNHRLVRFIGWEDAEKLSKAFAGEMLYPATCRIASRARHARVIELHIAGKDVAEISTQLNMSRGLVRYVIRTKTPEKTLMAA